MTSLLTSVNSLLRDYYRCPEVTANVFLAGDVSDGQGYFRLGNQHTCFGRPRGARPAASPDVQMENVDIHVSDNGDEIVIPFDPLEVVSNLRMERYTTPLRNGEAKQRPVSHRVYYLMRPMMPVGVRKHLQRFSLRDWRRISFPKWPVDRTVDQIHEIMLLALLKAQGSGEIPFVWFWPDGFMSCATITHDVETEAGRDFCSRLMDLNDRYGIKSSFQVVPEDRYDVPPEFLESLRARGYEVNVHDLNHDGHLFDSHERFLNRAKRINRYGTMFGAKGFRAGSLYRNLEWMQALKFAYDMSIPNVGHLDPQRGGCCTVMPYFVGDMLEIPVTTTQDYTLFHVLSDYSITLWKEEIEYVAHAHGMASVIIHPDYMIDHRASKTYEMLLQYLADLRDQEKIWISKPGEINDWWRARSAMRLVRDADTWRVEGEGSERARVAYAWADGDKLAYRLA